MNTSRPGFLVCIDHESIGLDVVFCCPYHRQSTICPTHRDSVDYFQHIIKALTGRDGRWYKLITEGHDGIGRLCCGSHQHHSRRPHTTSQTTHTTNWTPSHRTGHI